MAFQGSLAELHLPDIIQLVSVSGKTGVFHLVDGPHKGQIFLFEGRIVHAQLDDTSGEEAVYALAIWDQGDFKFEPGPPSETRTNLRPRARAIERPRLVLPTPGGPMKQRIGPLGDFVSCRTARNSRIRSLIFRRP